MPPWAGRIFFSPSEDVNIHSCVNCFPDRILIMFCWLEEKNSVVCSHRIYLLFFLSLFSKSVSPFSTI